ncbi:MAG: hypothetical protein UR12_C0010G0015 [candidate division TM6 bacterium GW2011_GWF2_30_66]|jgi:ankyrin repeat protein|nr:MAG: hypothetical protein UR12_C0010G0015 [candidate division TM6 bacterium GW2011_GWF2_30_66]
MTQTNSHKKFSIFLKIILALATLKILVSIYNFTYKNYNFYDYKNEFEKVDLIIKYGSPGEINKKIIMGETPLWWACYNNNFELVKYLIEHGAQESVNCADNYGDTPLWWACFRNNLPLVKYLIQNGANKSINVIGNCNLTPINWACKNNYTQLAEYLIKNYNPELNIINAKTNTQNNYTNNLMHNHSDSLKTLYYSCCNGNLEIVKYLVKNNYRKQANIFEENYFLQNTITISGNILSYAQELKEKLNAEKFFTSIYYACFENNINLINFVLFGPEKNFILSTKWKLGTNKILLPSLYYASISRNSKIIKYLIENYLD